MSIRIVQERLRAAGFDPGQIDGVWGAKTAAALDEALGLKASPDLGLPAGYLDLLATIESGNRPYVQAPSSSASGLFQFIKATWLAEGGAWGPTMRPAFGGLRPSEDEQRARAASLSHKSAAALRNAGLQVNKASLYACHFLGVSGALRILRAPVNTPIEQVTEANQRAANPSILKGKVSDFRAWLQRKTGDAP